MEEYYPYCCERCGKCCRRVDLIAEMKPLDRGDGVCKNLTGDNLCKIYDSRPPLCNGQYLYENFFSDLKVTEFHEIMSVLCKKIKES